MPVKMILRVVLVSGVCAMALTGCDWFVSTEDRIARAEKYFAGGEERAAAIELQNVLGSKPDHVQARLLLARVSLRQGDAHGAEQELRRAIEHHAPAAEVAVIGAEIQLAKGEYAALLAELNSGESGLDAGQTAIYRGIALLAMRNREEAITAFSAALAANPGSARARLGLAEAMAQGGDFDGALVEIDKVLATTPTDAHASSLKGRLLGQRGEYQAAAAALAEARKNAAGQLSVHEFNTLMSVLVEARLASGDVAASRSTLEALNQRAPGAPVVHLLAARIAMAEQNYPLAVTEAQKVIAAAPKHPMAKLVLGAALLANGNYHQAEAQLAELVQQSPENLEARKLLADTNLRLQRPDVAMEVLMPAQQSSSTDPQVEALLAWANLQRGNEGAAIELLKRSVASQPDNEGLKLDLALAYVTAGRSQEAITLLESLPVRPGSARRERLLIAAIAAGKNPQAAQVEVEKIVEAHAKDVQVLNVAASFHAQNRNFARARELLRAAIALEPKNTGSLSSLARLEVIAGDDAAARGALQALLAVEPTNQNALISLAQVASRNNDPKGAITHLEAARLADANAVEPRLLLATQYLRDRKTAQADGILRELATLSEANPAIAVVTGRLYTEAGRYDEALNQFRAAVRREPRNPAWLLEVARVLVARGDEAGGRDSLLKAIALDPQSIAANSLMIGLDLKDGRKQQALERAALVRKAHPDDAAAVMLEGDVHLALRDAPAAAKAFADSYRRTPSSAAAIRAYRARSIARLPASTALLTDWLQSHPQDVGARLIFAQALLEQRRHTEAIVEYERVASMGRPGAMALNNLAWLYQQALDPRAEATAKRAYELAPEVAAIADTYGWILVEAGKVPDALPLLEKAAAARGASAEVRYHHAVALARSDRKDEARPLLRALLGVPGFAYVAETRALLQQLGDAP